MRVQRYIIVITTYMYFIKEKTIYGVGGGVIGSFEREREREREAGRDERDSTKASKPSCFYLLDMRRRSTIIETTTQHTHMHIST